MIKAKRGLLEGVDFFGGFLCFLNAVYHGYVAYLGNWINSPAIVVTVLSLCCALLSVGGTIAHARYARRIYKLLLPTFIITFLITVAASIVSEGLKWQVEAPIGWFVGPMMLAFGSITIFISMHELSKQSLVHD